MKSIEDLRAQFNDAWDKTKFDKARSSLDDLVDAASVPTQRDTVAMHLAYWSKYNEGFDKMLDESIAAQKQKLGDEQEKAFQQANNAEQEANELKQQLERIALVGEIETLERKWQQLATRQITELQNQVTQQTARVNELEQDLTHQVDALKSVGALE